MSREVEFPAEANELLREFGGLETEDASKRSEADLHVELRYNGDLVAESRDRELWARVLVLVLDAKRPEPGWHR